MKIKKKSKKINKLMIVIVIALLVGIAALIAYALFFTSHKDESTDITQPTSSSSDDQLSKDPETTTNNKESVSNTDTPPAPTTNSESSKKQVQIVASADQSNSTVFIRGGINYPVTGGSCYAQLSGPSGQSIQKDSTILPSPATADCKTISIPASELAPGKWIFTLHYTSEKYEGVSNEASFSL